MSRAAIWIPVAIAIALAMEPWAALLHGRVWHHRLWPVHRSHHRPRRGRFEANDALSALHAPIAIALILYGCRAAPSVLREIAFGIGIGMTAFGLAYVVGHDGFVHGRLPVAWLARFQYFARVRDAHRVHHQRGEAPYGFFAGPWTLARLNAHSPPRARRASPNAQASGDRGLAPLRGTPPDDAPPSAGGT